MKSEKLKKSISILMIYILSVLYIPFLTTTEAKAEIITSTATLSVSIISNTSEELIVNILVNPINNPINVVGLFLNYSTTTLEAVQLNTEGYFGDFFIEQKFNNQNGKASILCGKPSPGISQEGIVGQIVFKKINTGWANLEIAPHSSVHANDGLGTNILGEINNVNLLFK